MPTAEVIVLAVLVIPIIAAFAIRRRERVGRDLPERPFWVNLGIALAILFPFYLAAGAMITALTQPN